MDDKNLEDFYNLKLRCLEYLSKKDIFNKFSVIPMYNAVSDRTGVDKPLFVSVLNELERKGTIKIIGIGPLFQALYLHTLVIQVTDFIVFSAKEKEEINMTTEIVKRLLMQSISHLTVDETIRGWELVKSIKERFKDVKIAEYQPYMKKCLLLLQDEGYLSYKEQLDEEKTYYDYLSSIITNRFDWQRFKR